MDRKVSKTSPVPVARSNTCGCADIEEIPTKIAFDLVGSRLNKNFHITLLMIAEKIHIDSVRSCNHQERIYLFGLKIDELPDTCSIYSFLQIIATGEEVKNG